MKTVILASKIQGGKGLKYSLLSLGELLRL